MKRMNNRYMLRGFSIIFLIMVCLATSLPAQRNAPQTSAYIAGGEITMDQTLRTPLSIRFRDGNQPAVSAFFDEYRKFFSLSPENEMRQFQTFTDKLGQTHYRYDLYYKGIQVLGAQYILHEKNGLVSLANGKMVHGLSLDVNPALPEETALMLALNFINADSYMWENPDNEAFIKQEQKNPAATFYPEGELKITSGRDEMTSENFKLVYRFDIYAQQPLGRYYVDIDAQTGAVVNKLDRIHHADVPGSGASLYNGVVNITVDQVNPSSFRLQEHTTRLAAVETYNMQNGTNYGAAVNFTSTSANGPWDGAGVSAHFGAEVTYDYYFNAHGRNSLNNAGLPLLSYVHYDVNYVNAFWDGTRMTYGDGDGVNFFPLVSLDVVGHELTHGVTEFSANLVYQLESGALNESFSDIFGNLVEFQVEGLPGVGTGSWRIGEDFSAGGLGFRNMANPNEFGDPDTYGGTHWVNQVGCVPGPGNDWCGVHVNSGVQNFWFFLLVQGGTGTNDLGDPYSVTGIGATNAGAIAYRNLTVYLTPNSNYADARAGSISAATDLFGAASQQVQSVKDAWDAVGVYGPVVQTGILVWEGALGGQDYSGAYINAFLTNAGFTTQYTAVFPASLIGYDAVFLSFGNYGANGSTSIVFDNTMAAAVQAYLQAGGTVYLEGGDALGFDQSGNTALLNLFGLASASDGGTNPIDGLQGQAGALTEGMLFTASTQVNNAWIDTYTAGGGAIAFVESGYGNVAAQFSGAAGQKTFCFSYALAALTDAAAPSTKDDLMAAIINFFGIAPPAAPDHLVWVAADVSGASAASGVNIFNALVANGRSALVTDNLFEFGNDLSQYDAVWVVLGIYPNNHVLGAGDPEAAALETYLANGGRIYLEGGDCFAYDPQFSGGYNINPWFDCAPVGDGSADVAGVIGLNQLSGFAFDYTGENNFMDELSAIGSSAIWQNDANTDIHGLYNTGFGAGDGRAIGVVPSFGGLTPPAPLNPETRVVKNFGSQEAQATSSRTKARPANKTARTVIKRFAYPSKPAIQRSGDKPLYKITPNGLELLANDQTALMAAYLGLFESTATGQVIGSVNSPAAVPEGGAFMAEVKVDMTNMPAPDALLGSFTATLTWDPACISYTGNSGILSGFTGFVNDGNAANGVIIFNGAKATGQGGLVDILNVNFQAVGPVGSNCCLNLQFSAMAAAMSFTNLLPFLTVNGSCINIVSACTPGLLGDINGDDAVNSLDALLMLSYDTGFPLPQPFLDRIAIGFGDATQDGLTNSTDALVTLSWEVGFPVPFPVGTPVCLPVAAALGKSTVAPAAQGAEVQAYAALNLSGQTLDVPVMINMAKSGEKLGSYTLTMSWNPALLEFTGFDGGAAQGFGDPVVNDLDVKQGRLIAAHAYPQGAEGLVNVLNARFMVRGNAQTLSDNPVSLSFSAMAAAQTFTDLLPAVKVVDAPAANEAPASFALDNYPNPFNPATEIRYQLPEAADVQIVVYNVLGQKVQTLVNGKQQAGTYLVRWEGKNDQNQQVPSGMYFLRMKAGKFAADRKLLLMK